MKKISVWFVLLLAGCSTVDKIVERTGSDLARTSEIAAKYNRPDVKICADWMNLQLRKLQSSDKLIAQLRDEETAGILSRALILDLIRDEITKQRAATDQAAFKKEFELNCNAVAGAMLFDVLDDARRVGSRGK